jgi:signal transduction histidine kinase
MLKTLLTTYKTDAVWIYRLDWSLVYSINSQEDAALTEAPVAKADLARLMASGYFHHCFAMTSSGPMELRLAPIQPTADDKRVTPPQGYFIIGRLWTEAYLAELMSVTASTITIAPISEGPPAPVSGQERWRGLIAFTETLPGWDGQPLLRLDVRSSYPILEEMARLSTRQVAFQAVFGAVILLLLLVCLMRWVTLPLRTITSSLDTEDTSQLAPLGRQRTELGRLATLIERFFEQKAVLDNYAARLEQSNRALDDFAYIVSHDLKEPLRNVGAFARFLADDYGHALNTEGQSYVERIRANAKRMQRLIDDLLAISRLSQKPNQLQTVDARALLEEVKPRFEHTVKEKGIQLLIHEPLPTLVCDRVRLAEVFANLISNAIKYHDKPAGRIEIGCREDGASHEFYVKDNGPGIPREYFEKIFEIFQRLGERKDEEGTGVGLTIVKKIVELHRGKVWLDSTVGQGTTFYFTIPKDGHAATEAQTPVQG